jgi:F0F1-type ATP synthase delta subunit
VAPETVAVAATKSVDIQTAQVVDGMSLPIQIYMSSDISRLAREVDDLDNFFATAAIQGAKAKDVPQASLSLAVLINDNKLNLLHRDDRAKLKHFLKTLRVSAPIVHASFATEPKPEFLMKLVEWLRREAHLYVVLQIGLQPNIAAGCVLRTTNKYFDFSFKRHFKDSKAKLATVLGAKV